MEGDTDGTTSTFNGFIAEVHGMDAPASVESVFQEWIEERVRGRRILVTDLEIYVDGKFYPLSMEEENKYMIRIASVSGRQ
ncbi:MAG: hypothetical protein LUQ27_01780 [Methanomassiliicoccales archaeon]|nr:hypothetical protein [Methanomassiliicoccales archaeon]